MRHFFSILEAFKETRLGTLAHPQKEGQLSIYLPTSKFVLMDNY